MRWSQPPWRKAEEMTVAGSSAAGGILQPIDQLPGNGAPLLEEVVDLLFGAEGELVDEDGDAGEDDGEVDEGEAASADGVGDGEHALSVKGEE